MVKSKDILQATDDMRYGLTRANSRRRRSEIGQFLTPSPIARFMASLFGESHDQVRILDAGAGAGALFGALVTELCSRAEHPHAIQVAAYENDEVLKPYLSETFGLCEKMCGEQGIIFHGAMFCQDFIGMALAQAEEGLFPAEGQRFTHAILNPPYKKISAQTESRRLLDAAGMGVSNLYAAFVWLAMRLLEPGGELVAITPRSFCNGPYFRRFRRVFLDGMSLRRIHVFESRKKAFGDDNVLQENIIFHAVKNQRKPRYVTVSSSTGLDFEKSAIRRVPYEHMVLPKDKDAFIHLVLSDSDDCVMKRMEQFRTCLGELGVEVSTGRVVGFRAKEYLRACPEDGTVPLIHPCHFVDGFIRWPAQNGKKPNAIVSCEQTRNLMVAAGHYVLTKRFTAKEERRRVVAAIYDPHQIEASIVGFENHLNYFHARGRGLPPSLAKGLAAYLNSSFFDKYFRLFSGHTQVNATDLRKMRYPSREELIRLGAHVEHSMPNEEMVDAILEKECESDE